MSVVGVVRVLVVVLSVVCSERCCGSVNAAAVSVNGAAVSIIAVSSLMTVPLGCCIVTDDRADRVL